MIKEAVILSAGKGERLMPLTRKTHKSLIVFNGRPLLLRIIEKIKELDIERIYINLYHHADKVENFLKNIKYPEIIIKKEKELMGTGGGIANFKEIIGGDFLLHNCDILHNFDLKKLIDFHIREKSFFTMGLKKGRTNSKIVLKGNRVIKIGDILSKTSFCYTGISIVSKKFLNYLPEGKSNLIDVLKKAIEKERVMGYIFEKGKFIDIGTWGSLYEAYISAGEFKSS